MRLNTIVNTRYGKGIVRHITPAGNAVVILYKNVFYKGDYTNKIIVRVK